MTMTNKTKTVMLGDFDKRDTEYLSELIADHLAHEGIKPESFAFHIEVEYIESEDNENANR